MMTRSSRLFASVLLMGAASCALTGCEPTSAKTFTAPEGHDGAAHGQTKAPTLQTKPAAPGAKQAGLSH